MKLCKDCVWFEAYHDAGHLELSKCRRPARSGKADRITGNPETLRYQYCSTQRLLGGVIFNYLMDCCGNRGIFFKPRDAQ